jgi:hypothetical protein
MTTEPLRHTVEQIVRRRAGSSAVLLSVESALIRGGISAHQVSAVRAEYQDGAGRRRTLRFVAKRLSGPARREEAVYRSLQQRAITFAPLVLAVHREGGATVLLLESITPVARWPWKLATHAAEVLRLAADLHAARIALDWRWDYERELRCTASATLDRVAAAGRAHELPLDGASLRALRRVTSAVDDVRRNVLSGGPFLRTLIHGDLHPGNAILARRSGQDTPVLLDWGRARLGSPLEDVASWIQSLGCWEPEARLRHDSLLRAYLRARGLEAPIATDIRHVYWFAGACNALAGALLHHVEVATSHVAPSNARARALWAAHDWLRIIRRADAMWREEPRAPRGERDRRRTGSRADVAPTRSPRSTHSRGGTSSIVRS